MWEVEKIGANSTPTAATQCRHFSNCGANRDIETDVVPSPPFVVYLYLHFATFLSTDFSLSSQQTWRPPRSIFRCSFTEMMCVFPTAREHSHPASTTRVRALRRRTLCAPSTVALRLSSHGRTRLCFTDGN